MIPMKDQKSTASQDQTHRDFPGNEDVFFFTHLDAQILQKEQQLEPSVVQTGPFGCHGKETAG